jgi:type I restriction enzyme M protein
MRPRPGETCHDYACGSAGLLIKLQLVARELDPTSRVPLKLSGQELQAESYAVACMNAIIHDMDVELQRGDTMINPKFRDAAGKIRGYDIVVANPMWNQPFAPDLFANDPFDRFRTAGGITSGKGDWAWLQHTLACLDTNGRAAVVLDSGAVTRGSGSKNEDKERNIRKWFVDNDYIDGVILLPENLFYNTNAAGIIIVLNKRKPAARKGKITLLNASKHFKKGRPKNYLPEEDIRSLAAMYIKGEEVESELTVITTQEAVEADYSLSPSRWVNHSNSANVGSITALVKKLTQLDDEAHKLSKSISGLLAGVADESR